VVLFLVAVIAVLPLYLVGPTTAYRIERDRVLADRAVADEDVAEYVASLTGAGDRIYNLGRETQIYVLAGREPAAYHVRAGSFEVDSRTFYETLDELRRDPPAVVIDTSFSEATERFGDATQAVSTRFVGGEYDLDASQREAFSAFLAERYVLDRTVRHATIYRLR
jgi:hypothetical protein